MEEAGGEGSSCLSFLWASRQKAFPGTHALEVSSPASSAPSPHQPLPPGCHFPIFRTNFMLPLPDPDPSTSQSPLQSRSLPHSVPLPSVGSCNLLRNRILAPPVGPLLQAAELEQLLPGLLLPSALRAFFIKSYFCATLSSLFALASS